MRLGIVHDNELASSIMSVHNRCSIGLQTFGTIIASICVNRWTSYLSCFLLFQRSSGFIERFIKNYRGTSNRLFIYPMNRSFIFLGK